MEEKKSIYYLMNSDGEILQELGSDLDRILNNDILIRGAPIRRTKKFDYKYIKLNYKAIKELQKQCPLAIYLLEFLSYKTNILAFSNGVFINQTNFAKEVGISRQTACNLFKKLKKLRVIDTLRVNNRNVYILNPYIALKGNQIYDDIAVKFEKTEWQRLSEKRGTHNE